MAREGDGGPAFVSPFACSLFFSVLRLSRIRHRRRSPMSRPSCLALLRPWQLRLLTAGAVRIRAIIPIIAGSALPRGGVAATTAGISRLMNSSIALETRPRWTSPENQISKIHRSLRALMPSKLHNQTSPYQRDGFAFCGVNAFSRYHKHIT
jgi:hypothetical protein